MTRDRISAAHRAAAPFLLALLLASPAVAGEVHPDAPRAPSAPAQVTLDVLATAVAGWVAAARGEPLPDHLPVIAFVDRATLAEIKRAAGAEAQGADTLALYDGRNRTIYLPRGWTGATPVEVSMLVHELVHHFQAAAGERFPCAAAREKDAYAVQTRWLEAFGTDLERGLGVNGLFLLLATNCMF
jgi:hypothetical protein